MLLVGAQGLKAGKKVAFRAAKDLKMAA